MKVFQFGHYFFINEFFSECNQQIEKSGSVDDENLALENENVGKTEENITAVQELPGILIAKSDSCETEPGVTVSSSTGEACAVENKSTGAGLCHP